MRTKALRKVAPGSAATRLSGSGESPGRETALGTGATSRPPSRTPTRTSRSLPPGELLDALRRDPAAQRVPQRRGRLDPEHGEQIAHPVAALGSTVAETAESPCSPP
ncbi:hypothetical protein ACFOZ0_12350 [Streptomyces yaanensis]|uniref:Uncharacterized protein n=1 Tax=Streptomyces yaanensis TaxID=1142239 RepID=A0ABV7SC08_9ACTN